MRIAIISDIHGNSVALEAVLDDFKTEHMDRIVCLGDVISGGPHPCEGHCPFESAGLSGRHGQHGHAVSQPVSK